MHGEHLSISLEHFVGGEGFDKVVVQVAAVRTLLDVAVLGEILHPHSDVHHRLPTVLAVETSLRTGERRRVREKAVEDSIQIGSALIALM